MARQTKQEFVYNYIHDRIFSCEYPPGTPLTEEGLSQQLNVSRTPVREAIQRLTSEGLLDVTPGVGLSVSQLRLDDLLEIYELRLGLESLAVKLFIEKRNLSLTEELSNTIALVTKAVEESDIDLFMEHDMKFHSIIAAGTRNKRLISSLDNIYGQINRMSMYVRMDSEIREITVVEHKKILDAIIEGDVDAAVTASEEHCMTGRKFYLKQLYNL